jgi:hypothetical protein
MMRVLRPPFRHVHIAWASLVVASSVVMALIPGGHPPPLAFVPFVLAAGVLGHLLLLAVAWLADRGRHRAGIANDAPSGWPLEAGILGLLLGGIGIAATTIAIGEVSMLRHRALEWAVLALVAAAHLAAFLALVLRHRSARWLAAAVAAGWGVALALQLREARNPGELAFGCVVIAALLAIAGWALRSRRLAAFLA